MDLAEKVRVDLIKYSKGDILPSNEFQTVASGHAIGHYLILVAYCQSRKLKETEVTSVIEHSKKIRDVAPSLAFSQISLICSLSEKVKDNIFQKVENIKFI